MKILTSFLRSSISRSRRHLGACLAQEGLLARRADDVVVGVAVAREGERVEPAERLVAGLQVDLGVVGGARVGPVLVEVAVVDVDVDAADRVDGAGEAGEVDVHQVVDLEPGELLDGLQRQLRAAVRVGGVELVGPDAGDVDLEVARQGEQGDRVAVRVEPEQHRRVGEAELAADLLVALVGADDQDRLRARSSSSWSGTDRRPSIAL